MDRKRLVDYLPDFMKNFAELKELMRVVNIETDNINLEIGRVLDEAFIEDCTEYGIKKYEKLCGILPLDTDTLEERKARVKIRWNDSIPYTFISLIRKLNAYCGGADYYDLDADLENYYLSIVTKLSSESALQEVENMLEKILPMNIHYESVNNVERTLNLTIYGVGAMLQGTVSTIQSENNAEHYLQTTKYPFGTVTSNKTVTIGCDLDKEYQFETVEYQSSWIVTHKDITIN